MKAQPDSPAHTVGGACQPPSKVGGYPQGTVWCCATCKALWYVNDHEWKFLSRPDQVAKPPLVLPTTPTWGIAFHRHHTNGSVALWRLEGDEFCWKGGGSFRAHNVIDFIPLTDEQVERIEAAR